VNSINSLFTLAQKKTDRKLLPVPEDKNFRRANKVVPMRVASGGTLTLLSRKIFNVMLYHTQKQGMPGTNAPPGDPVYANYYWVPLATFTADANFNSDDVKALRWSFDNLQSIRIHRDTKSVLGSDVLLSSYRIVNPQEKRGSKVLVGWEMPSAVAALAKNPDLYTWTSIYYLTILRTTAGLALYETAKRYATSETGLTMSEKWEWWFEYLTGVPVGTGAPEYKYFKRDTLQPAMDELNSLTDLHVELLVTKEGRKVDKLQFKVTRKKQERLELSPPPVIDSQIVARIASLGFAQQEAEDIFAAHDEGFLKATLDFTDARLADTKLAPLSNSAAFFRSALRGRYAEAKKRLPEDGKPKIAEQRKEPPPEDPVAKEARQRAIGRFDTLSEFEKAEKLAEFVEANPAMRKAAVKNPQSKIVRESLAGWLARTP